MKETELVQANRPTERTDLAPLEPETEPIGNRVPLVLEPEEAPELAPAPPTKGSIEVRVVSEDDGAPVEGIGLMIHPWSSDSWFHGRRGVTDGDGLARFELPPGEVGVYIERLSEPNTFGA